MFACGLGYTILIITAYLLSAYHMPCALLIDFSVIFSLNSYKNPQVGYCYTFFIEGKIMKNVFLLLSKFRVLKYF